MSCRQLLTFIRPDIILHVCLQADSRCQTSPVMFTKGFENAAILT